MTVIAESEIDRASLNLPFEVLAYIFDLACPELCQHEVRCKYGYTCSFDDRRYAPLVLGSVCSRWREVVFSSPELWSKFAFEGSKWEPQLPLLRLYLTNTGGSPFSLALDLVRELQPEDFGGFDLSSSWMEMQPLTDVIFNEFPEKIHTLRLMGALPGWLCLLSQQRLPNLHNLTFCWEFRLNDVTTITLKEGAFSVHPQEFIHMTGAVPTLQPALTFPPLTTLHFDQVFIDICVDILFLCPLLIEYHCYNPLDPPTDDRAAFRRSTPVKDPFSLPNLKSFGWTPYRGGEYNGALLRSISLPNLEELRWCNGEVYPHRITEEENDVFHFFSALPETIGSLTFRQHAFNFPDPGEYQFNCRLLSRFSRIESLIFDGCSELYLHSVFQILANRAAAMESFLLPNLRRITIDDFGYQRGYVAALIRMLKVRRLELQIPSFTIEAVNCVFLWKGAALDEIRELQYEFSLTVIEGSQEKIYAYFTKRELALFS